MSAAVLTPVHIHDTHVLVSPLAETTCPRCDFIRGAWALGKVEKCTECWLPLHGYVHRGGSRGPGINDNYDWAVHDRCYDAHIERESFLDYDDSEYDA